MPARDLPLELLDLIFENLWSNDLVQCQLVSHKWNRAVGLKLFRKVDFRTERNLDRFIAYLDKSHSTDPSPRGLLVEQLHFDMYQIFSASRFAVNFRDLMNNCSQVRSISSDAVISYAILQSLSVLPPHIQLNRLESIPSTHDTVHYSLCAIRYRQSLTTLDLRNAQLDRNILSNHEFPRLTKLILGVISDPWWDTIYSLMRTSSKLTYLEFKLSLPPHIVSTQAQENDSLRELNISSRVDRGLNQAQLNTFLWNCSCVEKSTISILDNMRGPSSLDAVPALTDFMFWINRLREGKLHIDKVECENVFTYIKLIFNTIPVEKEAWNTKLTFVDQYYTHYPYISYSTHTRCRERMIVIALENYFAKNLIRSYLEKLRIPFVISEK